MNSSKVDVTVTMNNENVPVFRFKIDPNVVEAINSFAKIHQYDDRRDYKQAWKEWCDENQEMLDIEVKRLETNGYTGNAYDKFFKSGRYYFRNKKLTKNEPVERKKYVGLSRDILRIMDDYISKKTTVINGDDDGNTNDDSNGNDNIINQISPANMFDMFCQENKSSIKNEIVVLLNEHNLSEAEISQKLKKTFKNRYFQKIRKN